MLVCFAYLAWIMIVAYYGGIWVYPVFKVLEPVPRTLFMLFCSALGALLYLGGDVLNSKVWHQGKASKASKYTAQPTTGMVTRSKKRAMKAD